MAAIDSVPLPHPWMPTSSMPITPPSKSNDDSYDDATTAPVLDIDISPKRMRADDDDDDDNDNSSSFRDTLQCHFNTPRFEDYISIHPITTCSKYILSSRRPHPDPGYVCEIALKTAIMVANTRWMLEMLRDAGFLNTTTTTPESKPTVHMSSCGNSIHAMAIISSTHRTPPRTWQQAIERLSNINKAEFNMRVYHIASYIDRMQGGATPESCTCDITTAATTTKHSDFCNDVRAICEIIGNIYTDVHYMLERLTFREHITPTQHEMIVRTMKDTVEDTTQHLQLWEPAVEDAITNLAKTLQFQ